MPFDAIQHAFGCHVLLEVGEFVHFRLLRADFLRHRTDHLYEPGYLMFREQTDVKVGLCTLFSRGGQPVLREEHESRQEERLYRGEHGQVDERWIATRQHSYPT